MKDVATFSDAENIRNTYNRMARVYDMYFAFIPRLHTDAGYVMQDDALFPMLTVRETLMYSARLRLSGKITTREKAQRVEDLIRELGLMVHL